MTGLHGTFVYLKNAKLNIISSVKICIPLIWRYFFQISTTLDPNIMGPQVNTKRILHRNIDLAMVLHLHQFIS